MPARSRSRVADNPASGNRARLQRVRRWLGSRLRPRAAHAAGFDTQHLCQARFDLGQLTDRRGAQPLAQGDVCIIAHEVGWTG